MTHPSPPEPSDPTVPDVVWRYYDAHDRRDTDAALSAFGADATVADDGHEYVGSGAIRHWLAEASTEFTYTRTVVGADAVGADTWVVTNHLEGNFPGNVVDLRYQFVVRGGRIVRLIIAP